MFEPVLLGVNCQFKKRMPSEKNALGVDQFDAVVGI